MVVMEAAKARCGGGGDGGNGGEMVEAIVAMVVVVATVFGNIKMLWVSCYVAKNVKNACFFSYF